MSDLGGKPRCLPNLKIPYYCKTLFNMSVEFCFRVFQVYEIQSTTYESEEHLETENIKNMGLI
jgi:hypothetical protein